MADGRLCSSVLIYSYQECIGVLVLHSCQHFTLLGFLNFYQTGGWEGAWVCFVLLLQNTMDWIICNEKKFYWLMFWGAEKSKMEGLVSDEILLAVPNPWQKVKESAREKARGGWICPYKRGQAWNNDINPSIRAVRPRPKHLAGGLPSTLPQASGFQRMNLKDDIQTISEGLSCSFRVHLPHYYWVHTSFSVATDHLCFLVGSWMCFTGYCNPVLLVLSSGSEVSHLSNC